MPALFRLLLPDARVSRRQWGTLLHLFFHQDLRTGTRSGYRFSISALLALLGFHGFTGVVLALALPITASPGFIAITTIVVVLVLSAASVALDFPHTLLSGKDITLLSPFPVEETTVQEARLAHLLLYAMALAAAFLPGPATMYVMHGGGSVPGLVLSVMSAACFAALVTAFVYGSVIRLLSPRRVRVMISLVHVTMLILVYGSAMLISRSRPLLTALSMEAAPPWWWPPSWFASFSRWGEIPMRDLILPHGLVLMGILLLIPGVLRIFSYRVSETLRTLDQAARRNAGEEERGREEGGEAAISVLLRVQFRENMKYRMAVLSILPVILFYVVSFLLHGEHRDPFLDPLGHVLDSLMVYMGISVLPFLFHASVTVSETPQAAWIMEGAVLSPGELVRILADRFFFHVLLPAHGLLLLFFMVTMESGWHGILHGVHMLLLGSVLLYARFLYPPRLPFSIPQGKVSQARKTFMALFVIPLLMVGYLALVLPWAYATDLRCGVLLVLLLGMVVLLRHGGIHQALRSSRSRA